MIFLPTVQLGRLRSVEITFLGQGVRTAQEENLERTQGPLCGVRPPDQLAEEDTPDRAYIVAGACRLVYFGKGRFIRTFHHLLEPQNVKTDGP